MNFLICMGSEEFSKPTIQLGGRLAKIFDSNISILYVSPKTSQLALNELWMSRDKLSEWEVELPGVKVLRFARQVLLDMDLVKVSNKGEIVKHHSIKPDVNGAYELNIPGEYGKDIRLRLREGDIVDQIKKEIDTGNYDITIVGASKNRRIVHHIIQFIDTSLLIVKNIRDIKYNFLIAADDSSTARSIEFIGSRIVKHFDAKATILSVAEKKSQIPVAEKCVKRASDILKRGHVEHKTLVKVGNIVDTIINIAGDDHVIILGSSRVSELKKFLFGSKPIKIVQKSNCPVLIFKLQSMNIK